jgi:hypothetical protein
MGKSMLFGWPYNVIVAECKNGSFSVPISISPPRNKM